MRAILAGAVMTLCAHAAAQVTRDADLIPRDVFFSNPERASVQISPDGAYLSWLAPVDGFLNVWIAPTQSLADARPVTRDLVRGIRMYQWAWDGTHLLYVQDEGGDENWQVHAVNVSTNEDRNLTPFEEILGADGQPLKLPNGKIMRPTAQIVEVSSRHPGTILVGLNNRDPQRHDLYRLELATGDLELVELNTEFLGYLTDHDLNVRFALRTEGDGSRTLLSKSDGSSGAPAWETFLTIPAEDVNNTSPLGMNAEGNLLFLVDSRGRDTAAFAVMHVETKEIQLLCHDPRADITGVVFHPTKFYPQAAMSNPMRTEVHIMDLTVKDDYDRLRAVEPGDLTINSRTADDQKWLAAFIEDAGPVKYYLYDRATKEAKFLFTNRPALEGLPLAKMHGVVIKSRDGLNLVSYLTLPVGANTEGGIKPKEPLPLVLFVHGGPWARDTWGYNGAHQWLANRGYAVLSVNFRGSTGFGKNFINLSNHQWAGTMHDDLIDAVNWAVEQGIADKERVGIMGGSYGGYATLVGLTFTPDVFACGVDIVGPSNLNTLLNTIPPYWKPLMDYWALRVGDPRTEEGRALLEARSPLNHVEKIVRPLLIAQGANDPRVKQSESDQLVAAMKSRGIPVTYVLYPDEGHGFARPENNTAFFAVAEQFLAQHLGGRVEPIGDDFKGSSIEVPEGAQQIPGLAEALPDRR